MTDHTAELAAIEAAGREFRKQAFEAAKDGDEKEAEKLNGYVDALRSVYRIIKGKE